MVRPDPSLNFEEEGKPSMGAMVSMKNLDIVLEIFDAAAKSVTFPG